MKRLISLLLTVCLMATICVPSASAVEATTGETSALDSRVTVAQGIRPMISSIVVYPVLHSASGSTTASGVYDRTYFQATSTARGVQLSPTETQNLIDKFKAKNGNEPNAWRVVVQYDFVDDGKGSYGKYFEWEPWGDLYRPTVNSNGKVRVDVTRFQTEYQSIAYFDMPEDTSKKYMIGLQGGFFYYCAPAGITCDLQSGYLVSFNYT